MAQTIGLPPFTSFNGGGFDAETNEIILDFSAAGDQEYQLRLPAATVGPLILALLDRMRALSATAGRLTEISPLQLHDATALSLEDGSVGIQVQLESNLQFAFGLEDAGVNALRLALSKCEELLASPSPAAAPKH